MNKGVVSILGKDYKCQIATKDENRVGRMPNL